MDNIARGERKPSAGMGFLLWSFFDSLRRCNRAGVEVERYPMGASMGKAKRKMVDGV